MLWIGLAIGTVIGVVVFLVIKLSAWVAGRLPGPRGAESRALPHRDASPDDVASYGHSRDAAVLFVDDIKQQLGRAVRRCDSTPTTR